MEKKTRNMTFQFIKAILILMVIDDHVSSEIGIFSSIFPYNSFYMPLFVFVSGYFFKTDSFIATIKRLCKRLLIPYILWSFIGNFISLMLLLFKISNWYTDLSVSELVKLVTYGPLSSITYAGWFAIMLFWVSIIYLIIRKCCFDNKIFDYMLLLLGIIISAWSVYRSMNGFASDYLSIVIYRALFYLAFLHMGYMFRVYWEDRIKRLNKLIVIISCIIINTCLIVMYGDKILYCVTFSMQEFNSFVLPYITFITGALFWYEIGDYLSCKIGYNKYVNFLANNTYTIMMSHLIFLNIPNYYIMWQLMRNGIVYDGFDYDSFIACASIVRYSRETRLVGFILGLSGSIIVCFLVNIFKKLLLKVNIKKKCEV